MWCHVSVISAPGRLRYVPLKSKAYLGYIDPSSQKKIFLKSQIELGMVILDYSLSKYLGGEGRNLRPYRTT